MQPLGRVPACSLGSADANPRRGDDGVAGSGAQLDRLLDPEAGNVTLETLQRAAGVLGRTVRVELV